MMLKPLLAVAFVVTFALNADVMAEEKNDLVVRLAKLQIDASQLAAYKTALKEEIEASIRLEPGVLALNAVSEKANPDRITILEVYASESAYKAHLETPHFKKYKATTLEMVTSLELVGVDPILLGRK